MKIIYDSNADALNITFRAGKVKRTLEIAPEIFLDIDAKSRPLYLEIIGAKEKLGKASTEEVTMKNLILDRSRTVARVAYRG
jgi:uncharacterized protein YuzE